MTTRQSCRAYTIVIAAIVGVLSLSSTAASANRSSKPDERQGGAGAARHLGPAHLRPSGRAAADRQTPAAGPAVPGERAAAVAVLRLRRRPAPRHHAALPRQHGLLRRSRAGRSARLHGLLGLGREGRLPGDADLPVTSDHRGHDRPRRCAATPTAPAGTWPTSSPSWAAPSGRASRRSTTRRSGPGGQTYDQHIANPSNQLGGIWVDDTNSITGLPKTSRPTRPAPSNTYTDLAAEAARAAAHFHVTDLANANFVIAQPPNYTDPNALSTGYCAFHDYTLPGVSGGIYNGIKPGISYTNMPYVLAINSGGCQRLRRERRQQRPRRQARRLLDRARARDRGDGHRPGSRGRHRQRSEHHQNYGGWYDPLDANENGDKCAYVGESLLTGGVRQRRSRVR